MEAKVITVPNKPIPIDLAGDLSLIPGLERSLGEGNGYPLQYSCLENLTDRASLVGYSPWCHKESDMTMLSSLKCDSLL